MACCSWIYSKLIRQGFRWWYHFHPKAWWITRKSTHRCTSLICVTCVTCIICNTCVACVTCITCIILKVFGTGVTLLVENLSWKWRWRFIIQVTKALGSQWSKLKLRNIEKSTVIYISVTSSHTWTLPVQNLTWINSNYFLTHWIWLVATLALLSKSNCYL